MQAAGPDFPGPQGLLCGEEAVLAADADLARPPVVQHLTSLPVGCGLGDFLIRGVAEMIAVEFDRPSPIVTHDADDGSFNTFLHMPC